MSPARSAQPQHRQRSAARSAQPQHRQRSRSTVSGVASTVGEAIAPSAQPQHRQRSQPAPRQRSRSTVTEAARGHPSVTDSGRPPPRVRIFGLIRGVGAGTRFDDVRSGSRRINGVRNIRQALASPHSALHSPIRRGPHRTASAQPQHLQRSVSTVGEAASPVSAVAAPSVRARRQRGSRRPSGPEAPSRLKY